MGRGRVRVKRNDLPKIIRALPGALSDGLNETTDQMENALRGRVWKDTGVVMETITDRDPAELHVTISVGLHKGRGFYSRFHEWGTVKMNARPVVGPTAHEYEPIFPQIVGKHIRKACGA